MNALYNRSDYGGGSTHMYELVRELNSSLFRKYVVCQNQKLRDKLAKEGRLVINERFNSKRMVFDTEELYCQLLKEEGIVPFEPGLS